MIQAEHRALHGLLHKGPWLLLLALSVDARADRLLLGGGGVVEGQILHEESGVFRLRSFAGEVDVPALLVVRRITEPSRIETYEKLLGAGAADAPRHAELARWCVDQKLPSLAARHIEEALRLDPAQPEARRLSGFVRLEGVWLKAADPPAPSPTALVEDERIVEQLRSGWQRRIHALRDAYLREKGESLGRTFESGRQQLLALRAPLAIDGACVILGDEPPRTRIALAEFLGGMPEDAAGMNLAAMCLLDADAVVRAAAADAAVLRADCRVVDVLRIALRARVDEVVRRAAVALGRMGSRAAFEDLVAALPTDAFGGEQQSLRAICLEIERRFDTPTSVPLEDRVVLCPARIALPDWVRRVDQIEASAVAPTSRFRSEVQEALIALSGENHGFDTEAWLECNDRLAPPASH